MLPSLHRSISALLHTRAGFDPAEVEVSFRQPSRQWADSRPRPTVNCFLYGLEEYTELRNSSMQTTSANGRATQRLAPRRFNLRYQVTAWSSEPEDEQLLIWRVLAALTRYQQLPEDLLDGEVRESGLPIHTRVGPYEGGPTTTDLWSALSLPPRPALLYSVVVPLDLDITLEAPLVLSSSLRFRRADTPAASLDREAMLVGGTVRDRDGTPIVGATVALDGSTQEVPTDSLGRYTLRLHRPGPAHLTVTVAGRASHVQSLTFDHPSSAYDIALD